MPFSSDLRGLLPSDKLFSIKITFPTCGVTGVHLKTTSSHFFSPYKKTLLIKNNLELITMIVFRSVKIN